jgi:hypothetical protein
MPLTDAAKQVILTRSIGQRTPTLPTNFSGRLYTAYTNATTKTEVVAASYARITIPNNTANFSDTYPVSNLLELRWPIIQESWGTVVAADFVAPDGTVWAFRIFTTPIITEINKAIVILPGDLDWV